MEGMHVVVRLPYPRPEREDPAQTANALAALLVSTPRGGSPAKSPWSNERDAALLRLVAAAGIGHVDCACLLFFALRPNPFNPLQLPPLGERSARRRTTACSAGRRWCSGSCLGRRWRRRRSGGGRRAICRAPCSTRARRGAPRPTTSSQDLSWRPPT